MKLNKISKNIVHVQYETQLDLARAFVRIQEHYENPQFRGKIFTLGEFREWYSKQFGAWTYYDDWNGFNVPSRMLKPFIAGTFDPLTEDEKKLIEQLRYRQDEFYLIGTHDGAEADVLPHEMCHAMFGMDPNYRFEVLETIRKYDTLAIRELLIKDGYAENVVEDEINAYVTESSDYLTSENVKFDLEMQSKLKELKKLYLDLYFKVGG